VDDSIRKKAETNQEEEPAAAADVSNAILKLHTHKYHFDDDDNKPAIKTMLPNRYRMPRASHHFGPEEIICFHKRFKKRKRDGHG